MTEQIRVGQEPAQYLEAHGLTRKLDGLGVTREQRQSMQFSSRNEGYPFDQWTTCWIGDIPAEAIVLVKPYCALKWLILDDPIECRDTDDAWRLVSATMAAPLVTIGLRTKAAQSKRAKQPRGKVTDAGETLSQLIKELVLQRQYRHNTAKELWPHFFDVLNQNDLDPKGIDDPASHTTYAYRYDWRGGRKEITFRRFANIVSSARSAKSRQPG